MDAKGEGAALPQVPLRPRIADLLRQRGRRVRETAPPHCAVCGAHMVKSHGHGLCPGCGFLAGPRDRT